MEWARSDRLLHFFNPVLSRAQKLAKDISGSRPRASIAPWRTLVISFLLALGAASQTETPTPPSPHLWKDVLNAHGFHEWRGAIPLLNPEARPEDIQVSLDRSWVYLSEEANGTHNPSIFCYNCKHLPTDWRVLGQSWSALSQLSHELKTPALEPSQPKPRHRFQDPREIQY